MLKIWSDPWGKVGWYEEEVPRKVSSNSKDGWGIF